MENNYQNEIRKGLLTAAVLQAISKKRCYANEILQELKPTPFSTQEGTLYPLLSKLKREGFVEHEWVESTGGPPRKYYSLSNKGNEYLNELITYVKSIVQELDQLGGSHHAKN